ncbi:hypothetical protein IRJ41_020924 [Triplophysa rosa]|uniref:Uncharacterized protein n=1 Tax=Triplophysa rosa TaxID=992332 RepID=A0A9W7WP90_TRIRA|nr:hypothetical protein IRJ41_020924 [Triplophysa rosa]
MPSESLMMGLRGSENSRMGEWSKTQLLAAVRSSLSGGLTSLNQSSLLSISVPRTLHKGARTPYITGARHVGKRVERLEMFPVYRAEGGHSVGQQADLPPATLTFAPRSSRREPEHLMT